ncbi:MAG: hypothetical protein Q9203_003236, partial [Teloschistes exilis]
VGRKGLGEFLEEGKSAWSPIPPDRFNHEAYYHPNAEKPGFLSSKGAYFLSDDLYAFDPSFFKISAEEARSMDPQHRILLECAFEAAENAGLPLRDLLGSNTGVFAAGVDSDYNIAMTKDMPTSSKYVAIGVAQSMFANRLSQFFGLAGPSITLDAAWASSAYALHLACQSVVAGECSTAFVGGSKLLTGPFQWMGLDMMGCISWNPAPLPAASGFGKGEGAACIIIKRLLDALSCGDSIRAVIHHTACNHSGRTQGISMPSRIRQEELLRKLRHEVGVDTNETAFVEGHGTGTPIGHLEGASGLMSIVKCIMMLERGVLVPNADFREMNPEIEGHDRLKVLTKSVPWPSGMVQRACISFGGSNAAILLEEEPKTRSYMDRIMTNGDDVGVNKDEFHQDAKDVRRNKTIASRSSVNPEADLGNMSLNSLEASNHLAFTLGQRKTHFAHRVAVAAKSASCLKDHLRSMTKITKSGTAKDPVIAFTFTGQGAQYHQMSAGLRQHKDFAKTILKAEQLLLDLGASWSLTKELDKNEHESRIDDAEISQPACTAVQLALAVLLRSWRVLSAVALGHSSGEIAAAFTAGLEILTDSEVRGGMLAIGTSAEEAQQLFEGSQGYIDVAAVNSPNSVTISGDVVAIQHVHEQAEKQGLFVRRLKVGVAYHSRHMEGVADSYLASINPFCSSCSEPTDQPSVKPWFISTVTGQRETVDTVNASYWVENLLQPVQCLKAMEALFSNIDTREGNDMVPNIMVELGPYPSLQSASKQILDRIATGTKSTGPIEQVTYLSSLVCAKQATTSLLNLAGSLFAAGLDLDLAAINHTDSSSPQMLHDLPPYEWNKTVRYIHQSRIAANWLHAGSPYHRLLGWKSPYCKGDEHAFRNIFTLDDLPWVRDHVVTGDILFPFTAFLSLAVEGFRSLDPGVAPAVLIREFHVPVSLRIEEDQPVDLTTSFETLSWSDAHQWTRHSYGLIEADHSQDSLPRSSRVQSALEILNRKTLQQRDAQHEYTLLEPNHGFAYGPTFRNMTHLWQDSDATVSTIVLRKLEVDPHGHPEASPVTVDPPTLDDIFHTLGVLMGRTGPGPTMVPSFCLRWRISNRIAADVGRQFSVVCTLLSRDNKSGTTHLQFVIFNVSTASSPPKPVAEIGPIKIQCIDRPDAHELRLPDSYTVKQVPYANLVDPDVLSEMVKCSSPETVKLRERYDIDRVAIHFLSRMLKDVANNDLSSLPVYHARFLAWAKRAVKAQQSAVLDSSMAVDKVSSSTDMAKMVCAVGAQLPQILRGEQQPLNIMFEDGLLQRSYEQYDCIDRVNQAAAGYIALLAACNPDLNILEIGGGTASATLPILRSIERATQGLSSRFQYTFTDISPGFFNNARTKLSQWTGHLTYSKLDISQDPLSQGFAAESYGVVLAMNVLHATPNIIATLENARTVLKPNGKLVLDGGYRKDSYRSPSSGPLLTKGLWNDVLSSNGFSGVEGFVDDYPGQPEHLHTAMWSKKCDTEAAKRWEQIDLSVTIYHRFPKEDVKFSETVSTNLVQPLGCIPTVRHLPKDVSEEKDTTCVVLDTFPNSMLSYLSSSMFYAIKDLLIRAPNVLWVLPEKSHPDASTVRGVLRSLRLELSTSRLVLLEAPFDACRAVAIARVVKHMVCDPNSIVHDEQEYSLIDRVLHVPRLQLVEAAKETLLAEAGGSVKREQNIWQEDNAIEMTLDNVGSPGSLCFRHSDILDTELGAEEIIVRVSATGINFRDRLLVLGSLSWHAPGLEGAGVVTRVGARVNDLCVGDRVFYIVHEAGMANFVRLPSLRAHGLPEGLDMIEAASLPIAYSTAIVGIIDIGRLRRGQTVLVHSASGAVGQACIMIAQHIGAQIFATAGSVEKREVAQTFGIPMNRIFSSRDSEFKDAILEATDDRGVDLVVNSLSGPLLRKTWDLVAENSTFVEIGKEDLLENSYLPMRNFDKNVTFSAIDLRKLAVARPDAVKEWLSSIVHLIESQQIMPIRPVTSVPISEVKTGLRKLQSGQNICKIVATLENQTVMVEHPSPLKARSESLLHQDATYLISGGTGGIGRALASWMIKKGARNLVLLGRSGASRAHVIELLKRYDGTDIYVRALACDISSRSDMIRTVEALRDLPRVRGVIHGALELRDIIFANATFEDWQQVVGPKVRGAWHLHELFPKLDFFVSLSSILGVIGRIGTSIYARTSTFLDAFSEHRIRLGMPAVTIDLPLVEGVGFAVDRGILEQLRANLGMTVSEDHLYALIEGAIIGPSSGLNTRGRGLSWTLPSKTEMDHLAWEHFNPLSVMRRLRTASGEKASSDESKTLQDLLKDGSHELLLDALGDKVSSITIIDRDEFTPDRSLLDYGLDSLFSLELRNWIRRRLNVDVALKDTVSAKNLKALAERIAPQTKLSGSVSTPSRMEPPENNAAKTDFIPGSSSHPVDGIASRDLPLSPLLGYQTKSDTTGYVDIDKVVTAWNVLCVAQPMLRTVFTSSPLSVGAFQQIILKRSDPRISHATVDSQAGINLVLGTMEEPRFTAGQPQHHVHLTRASESVVYATFYMSHALFDYRSFRLIGQQLCEAYADLASIRRGLDISSYISWVQRHSVAVMDYWKAYLSGTRPCFTSIANPAESRLLERTLPAFIDVSIDQPHRLLPFCRQYGVTLANVVQVAWGIVLRQCNGLESVTFGCAQSQIGNVEGDVTMLGPLLTNVICRFDLRQGTTLLELLKRAREDSLEALELPSFALAELNEAIGLGQSSLFDTSISVVRYPPEMPTVAEGYDNNKIIPGLWFDPARIFRSLAEAIGSLFATLMMEIVRDPDQPIEALDLSSDTPSMAFSAQNVARNVYREAASQYELSTSSLEDLSPCSLLQQQQQVQASIQQRSGCCVDQYVFRLPDHVSKIALSDVLDTVAAVSPALRTRFVSLKQAGTCQVIVKTTPGWNTETSLSDYLQWDKGFGIRYGGPPCRFGEVNEPDGKAYFVLSLHPAIYDPWTLRLIVNAVNEGYEDEGQSPDPFRSFSAYVRRLSDRNNAEAAQNFWSAQPRWSYEASSQFPRVLQDAPEADLSNSRSLVVQLPLVGKSDVVPTTLPLLPAAAWALSLSRLSGDGKACFGIHVDGRSESDERMARITGPVGAIMPCAMDLTALDTSDSLLGAIRDHVKAATPLLRTLTSSETSISHGIGKNLQPLGSVLVVHEDPVSVRQTEKPEILKLMETRLSESWFAGARLITRCRVKPDGTLCIEMQYDKQVISAEDIDVLLQQYKHAMTQLLLDCSAPLADLDAVSDYERSLLLQWNKSSPSSVNACIHDQIREIAKQQPTAPAICSWDCDLDHRQLDDFSDRLAALLQQNGTKTGAIVPWFQGPLGMTAATRTLQFSNFIFDAVIHEVFITLAVGGCICVPSEAERMNNITGAIQRMRVNWALLSPSAATLLSPSEVPTLRTLCLGGEPFRKSMIERWTQVRLINCYGPCEVIVMSSQCIVSPGSGKHHLNLGRPIPSRYWVVDPSNHNQLVPFGCPGELLVQGPGVAQGYLKDAEQTRQAFIEPPIWAGDFGLQDLSLQRWYKTGDVVKQTADGSVIFDGRKGTQVKLYGQRVELGEIEHHLEQLSGTGWMIAVELIKPCHQELEPCLAMFFAAPETKESAGPETPGRLLPSLPQRASILRQALISKLPAYMVPQYFIRLSSLPLTSSNKADRQWLRKLGASLRPEQLIAYSGLVDTSRQAEVPQNVVHGWPKANDVENPEAELRKLWSQTLTLPASHIKATDSFFSLGDSSLRAMRLVNTARRAGFSLTVTDVFTKPVFSDLAAAMRLAASSNVSTSSEPSSLMLKAPSFSCSMDINSSLKTCLTEHGFLTENVESVVGATDMQADMIAVSELDGKGYKAIWIMEFQAPGLEVGRITRACETVIQAHIPSRTAFLQHEISLQQVVVKSSPKGVVQVNIDEEKAEDEAAEDHIGPDTVLADRLPQFRLQVKGARCYKLRLKIHHALYDAMSLPIILQDLRAAYSQQALQKAQAIMPGPPT